MKPYVELLTKSENSFIISPALLTRENLSIIPLEDTLKIKIPPPENYPDTLIIEFAGRKIGNRNLMFVQDQVLASFLKTNAWKRPVYFAFTCAPSNLLNLQDNLASVGTVIKLVPEKGKNILVKEMGKNKGKFRQKKGDFRLRKSPFLFFILGGRVLLLVLV